MPNSARKKPGLTGNQLKILAMIAMTCDHVGLQLLPQYPILRILGRLAMPIYAYMVTEGCRHTRDRRKYLLRMAGMALLCQAVYLVAMGSLYQCILVTFSLSICMIYALEDWEQKRTKGAAVKAFGMMALIWVLCRLLPDLLTGTDFAIDYGFFGVLLPVLVYFGNPKWWDLTIGLVLLAMDYGGVQWWALAAVPILMLYNGQRGKASIGPLFYWYYPVHLVVIYGLSLI